MKLANISRYSLETSDGIIDGTSDGLSKVMKLGMSLGLFCESNDKTIDGVIEFWVCNRTIDGISHGTGLEHET